MAKSILRKSLAFLLYSPPFYLNEKSIGQNLSLESYHKLAKLDEYTSVSTAELTIDLINNFHQWLKKLTKNSVLFLQV